MSFNRFKLGARNKVEKANQAERIENASPAMAASIFYAL
jgi:hypothetical protein